MTTKQFIEKAIEGGYKDATDLLDIVLVCEKNNKLEMAKHISHLILLDPKSWQAVGKVEGWGKNNKHYSTG